MILFNECKELGIELIIINVSEYRYYNFSFYLEFCNEIVNIINTKSKLNKSFTEGELKQIFGDVYIVIEDNILIKKQKGFKKLDENGNKIKVPSLKEAEEIAYKVNKIIDSDIDFNKIGWVGKVSKNSWLF